MSEMYPATLSEEEIQRAAEELILKHGNNALAEAGKEISVSNSRGDFSFSGSWVLVCKRIRELQMLDDFGNVPDKNVMS